MIYRNIKRQIEEGGETRRKKITFWLTNNDIFNDLTFVDVSERAGIMSCRVKGWLV